MASIFDTLNRTMTTGVQAPDWWNYPGQGEYTPFNRGLAGGLSDQGGNGPADKIGAALSGWTQKDYNADPFKYGMPEQPGATLGTATPQATPAPQNAGQDRGAPVATTYGGSPGTGASWGQDGSYKLPTGEVLPPAAAATLDIYGKQVRVPGYYNPQQDTLIINQNGSAGENAMAMLSRRLKEAAQGGANLDDPNVVYRELARVREAVAGAYKARYGTDPTEQQIQAVTGMPHLNRFIRGANGETGYATGGASNQTGPGGATPVVSGAPAGQEQVTPTPQTQPPVPQTAPLTGQTGGNTVVDPVKKNDPGAGGQMGNVGGNTPYNNGQVKSANMDLVLSDPASAFQAYMQSQFGPTWRQGTSSFDKFFASKYGKIPGAALAAAGNAAGGVKLTSPDDLFSALGNAFGNGSIFSYLGDLANSSLAGQNLGGLTDQGEVERRMAELQPLQTVALNDMGLDRYKYDMEGYENEALNRRLYDPSGAAGVGIQDWGTFALNSPFGKRFLQPRTR